MKKMRFRKQNLLGLALPAMTAAVFLLHPMAALGESGGTGAAGPDTATATTMDDEEENGALHGSGAGAGNEEGESSGNGEGESSGNGGSGTAATPTQYPDPEEAPAPDPDLSGNDPAWILSFVQETGKLIGTQTASPSVLDESGGYTAVIAIGDVEIPQGRTFGGWYDGRGNLLYCYTWDGSYFISVYPAGDMTISVKTAPEDYFIEDAIQTFTSEKVRVSEDPGDGAQDAAEGGGNE